MSTHEPKFGDSPWDSLSREELLREVWRMASALVTARSALYRYADPHPQFELRDRVLSKINTALDRYDQVSDEVCYHSFFRYANDLLFPPEPGPNGSRSWMVCEHCGRMFKEENLGISLDGDPCPRCNHRLRVMDWDDLKKGTTDGR